MSYIIEFSKSLPNALAEQEQNRLLNLYYSTKDENARQLLLEHNLRLCLKAANELCTLYGLNDMLDPFFSICCEELANSLDRFDPNQEIPFASFALTNMKFQLISYLEDESYYSYPLIDSEIQVREYEGDEDTINIFDHLYDEDESAMPQRVASDLFIEDITNFINNTNWTNQRKTIVKMYLGLEVSKSYAKSDIANMLNLSRQRISQILDTSLPLIQNYISKNYQHLAANTRDQNTLNFETLEDRNLYIFESYYGLNGKQSKNAEQLAKEFSITPQFVREIIYEYKTNYENEHNSKLSHSRVSSNVYYEDYKESIVNDYYGLNGSKVLDLSEIIIKYNLSLRRGSLYSLIQDIVHTAVAENKLSVDDLAKIQSERHEKKKIQELNKLAYVFNSYYGLNGHENKRKFQLAQEFGVALSTIEGWISKYKKHLENTSSPEEIVENSKLS